MTVSKVVDFLCLTVEGPDRGPCVVTPQRSTPCPWNVAAGSLLDFVGILLVPAPPPAIVTSHHEKSHRNIKANGPLFPALTGTLFLSVGIFFRLRYPGCGPQEPPLPNYCCWPGLALTVGEEAPAVCLPGSQEEEGKCDTGPPLRSLLFWGPQGSRDEPPQSPSQLFLRESKRGATARSSCLQLPLSSAPLLCWPWAHQTIAYGGGGGLYPSGTPLAASVLLSSLPPVLTCPVCPPTSMENSSLFRLRGDRMVFQGQSKQHLGIIFYLDACLFTAKLLCIS